MFGLSTKEVLTKVIRNACQNKKQVYKNAIMRNWADLNSADENQREQLLFDIQKEYLDAVVEAVFASYQVSSPMIYERMFMVLLSPSMCGYEEINPDNGMMAGSLYAICYYALKNKYASPNDCIRLNHIQNEIMNQALHELQNEIK